MDNFDDIEDADTLAKKRYYKEQKKFARHLVDSANDEDEPNQKLV